MSIKLILIGIIALLAILTGVKVAKSVVKLVIILVILGAGYFGYQAYTGKSIDTNKIARIANESIDTGKTIVSKGKKAYSSINEIVQPILKKDGE